jgi:hypothetical protein
MLSLGLPLLAQTNSVVMQPNMTSLAPLQQQQFTLQGYGLPVEWSVRPAGMGTITSTGLYTASATVGSAIISAQPIYGTGSAFMSVVNIIPGVSVPGGGGSPSPTGPAPGPAPTSPLLPPSSPSGTTSGPSSAPTPTAVSIAPSSASLQAGQSISFAAIVLGTGNQQVQWSLSPNVGSIAGGVYTAPALIGSESQVTVWATSLMNPSISATATVLLTQPLSSPIPVLSNVSISIAQGPATLTAGQSAQFTATVQGAAYAGVLWSLSPNVGTVFNGIYTAPATITSQQTVMLTAASAADPTVAATIPLLLQPATPQATLSLSPAGASLNGGQSATFTPMVNGTSNTAVTWSISPQVGTVAGGAYQAPAIIASQQTVTVTATSVADSTASASASVTLQPVAVTIGPSSATVGAGQTATFTAPVTGTSHTAVTWSLSPAVGTLVNGVYTAPSTVGSAQSLILTATSVADPNQSATASITLTPGSSAPSSITMPLEVIGPNGTTVSAPVTIPSGSNLSGPIVFWMKIHGLRSETQASVQVNNSSWMPINSSTMTLLGNAQAYGGIGGGFATLSMFMTLPAGTIQAGTNTFSFRFNQTDGRVSGFRVLKFNIQASDGTRLIPDSTFVQDDPNTWQPPSTSPSDIAAGQALWHTAALTIPLTSGGTQPIVAHCSDCHTQDGRDLKYFNYSNNSIQARSLFHGLTAQQGDQIASYVRTLNVPNPGMPWNPPYQPGPGLDSQPVSNWAAGAGLEAVADSDQDVINAIFPSGIQSSVFAATSRLDQREIPLPLQLPDWNQWLPGTSPMDAFGATFTTNSFNTIYQTLSATLQVNNPAVYVAQQAIFQAWFGAFYGLYQQVGTPIWNNSPASWTPANVDAMYSLSQWGLVKTWELNSQFQLEGYAQNIFGSQADPRAWYSNMPFFVSPHELKMPTSGVAGLRNGTQAEYVYLSYIWYNLQLILNDSNGQQQEQYPIDWPYSDAFVMNLGELLSPQGGIQTIWMIKGLQILQQAGTGPQLGLGGWQPTVSQPSLLVTREWIDGVWTGVDPTTRVAIATGLLQSWLQQASQFTPQQYYAGGWTTPTAVPVPFGSAYDNVFPDWVWYMVPRFNFIGVNPALVSQLAQWAQTIWPNANWTADLNATCNWQDTYTIQCSE